MPELHSPVTDQILGATIIGPQNLTRLVHGFELFMEGLMNVTIHQIEVSQSLVTGGLADLDLLARARSPTAFVEAEIEIMRRRSERFTKAVRMIVEDVNRSWVETYDCIQPVAGAKGIRQ